MPAKVVTSAVRPIVRVPPYWGLSETGVTGAACVGTEVTGDVVGEVVFVGVVGGVVVGGVAAGAQAAITNDSAITVLTVSQSTLFFMGLLLYVRFWSVPVV